MEQDPDQNILVIKTILQKYNATKEEIAILKAYLFTLQDLKEYLEDLHPSSLNTLMRSFYLTQFERGQLIFKKGAYADKWYIIIQGIVKCEKYDEYGNQKSAIQFKRGDTIGERGIVRKEPRSLTAVAQSRVQLITLDSLIFDQILGNSKHNIMNQKKTFLEESLLFKTISYARQIDICKRMDWEIHHKGIYLARAGEANDKLYFIVEGELTVYHQKVNIVKLVRGSYFGEESVLNGSAFLYDVQVTSDWIKIYTLTAQEILNEPRTRFPKTILGHMKQNLELKLNNREKLQSRFDTPQSDSIDSSTRQDSKFSMATPAIRNRLALTDKLRTRQRRNNSTIFTATNSPQKSVFHENLWERFRERRSTHVTQSCSNHRRSKTIPLFLEFRLKN